MIKKLFAKLMGAEWPPQPSTADKFKEEQRTESELAEERRQEILRRRKESKEGEETDLTEELDK